jgi:uncharacterized damage-inducible protein DinB
MEDILKRMYEILSAMPGRWIALAETLPDELLARPPAPNEWSAKDCLLHLIENERKVFPVRVQAFLDGQDFPAFDPDQEGTIPDPTQTARDYARQIEQLRAGSLALLKQVTPEDLPRRARHAELGMVSLEEMLHEWAGHDLMHTVQAERALMQPFILGCGAWQSYFSDQFVRGG